VQVKSFWEKHPVAAAAIASEPGSPEFFASFDRLREAPECEPWSFSNRIHGYDSSRGKRVLDVGCGNGYVLAQYARYGAEVFGIDLTETAVELSRRRFELGGLKGKFSLTDGDSIPYPDASFDIVCSMGVLHHIADPRPMIREIMRVLRPGGQIILMLYYRYSYKRLVVLPLKRLVMSRYRGKSMADIVNMNDGDDCPLAKLYNKTEVKELLSGFENPEFVLNQLSWRQLFLIPGLGTMLSRVLPSCSESIFARALGWNLYAHAKKPINAR
jgi:SAM-dependent methyltransferase